MRAVIAVLIMAAIVPSAAQGNVRSWVSVNGSDANDCTQLSPCLSWSRAYDVTDPGGEMDALTSGTFGPLTIDKSITIDGNGLAQISNIGGTAITIDNPSASVRVRGLSLNGFFGAGTTQHGIWVHNARSVRIDHVRVTGFAGVGINVAPLATPSRVSITDSIIYDNGVNGVVSAPGPSAAANTAARVTIRDSVVSGNGAHGLYAVTGSTGARATINAYDNLVNDNLADGVRSQGSLSRINISLNDISGNLGQGLRALSSGQIVSFSNNRVIDNVVDGVPTSSISSR